MAKKKKEKEIKLPSGLEPFSEDSPPTTTEIQKTLKAFIEETRTNFSVMNSDREHDHNFMQTINGNVTALEGKFQNLSSDVKLLADTVKQSGDHVAKTVQSKVDEIKNEVAPKKFIIQEVGHFSFKLWLQEIKKRIFK